LQKARQQRQRCTVDILPLHTCHVVDHAYILALGRVASTKRLGTLVPASAKRSPRGKAARAPTAALCGTGCPWAVPRSRALVGWWRRGGAFTCGTECFIPFFRKYVCF
jgi:hypothetical protein